MEEELVAARKLSATGTASHEDHEELKILLQETEARAAELEVELASMSDQLIAKDQEVIDARARLEEFAAFRQNATSLESFVTEKTEEIKALKVRLAVRVKVLSPM